MKLLTIEVLLITLLSVSFSTIAELYKGVDEEGNVIYSDKPLPNSKKFTPPSLSIIEAPKTPIKKESVAEEKSEDIIDEKPVNFKYKSFSITSPTDEQTIWNEPQLVIQLAVKPPLNTKQGHSTWLFMDGSPIIKNSKKLTLPIGRIDRGSHTLQALIKNSKGKVVKQTKTITVFIQHAVIKRQPKIQSTK